MVTLLEKTQPYRKGTKVRVARDLLGVPEGTRGKVKLINGTHWLRYWVAFDNGEWIGSIDHADLVPVGEWDDYLVRRERGDVGGPVTSGGDADGDGGAAAAVEGEGYTLPNGVVIPAILVERTKRALEKAGNPRAF